MPKFGKRSKSRLKGVDKRLLKVLDDVIQHFDITVIEGKRTKARQKELFDAGATKTMRSKHLIGLAVDIAPYPVNFNNTERFCYMAGFVMAAALKRGYKIRWGRDWKTEWPRKDKNTSSFLDYVHFELVD